ncbi:MAG: TonB-dependent receptor [Acidobacteria bacterium]|nr:TonB-dependent receptor [Acidobacteriota bacterium]
MRRYFILLLFGVAQFHPGTGIISSLRAQGEGALHGLVVSQADKAPLGEVKIKLEGAALPELLQTSTGEDGHFGFQQLPPGLYSLVAEHEDFAGETLQFTLRPREVQNVTLSLSLRALTTTVQITADVVSLPSIHSPSSTVLDAPRLERLPLNQRSNIPEVMVTAAPGMIRGHDDFVHVRGQEIALNTFINGISFWENPHSLFSGGLSPEVIHSASVMTGGFSAEYGNRFGGVLDVVTKSGFSMDHQGALAVGMGSALRHNLGVEYGGHTQKLGYYLFSSGFESARFLSPPDPRSIHNTGRGSHNFFQLDVNLDSKNTLRLLLMGDGTNFEIPKTALDDQARPGATAIQRTREETLIAAWGYIFSKDALLNTSFYQRWSRSLLLPEVDPLAATARSDRSLLTAGLKSDMTAFLGRHTVKSGVDLVLLRPDEALFFDAAGYVRFTHLLQLPHVHLSQPIQFGRAKSGGQISLYVQDAVRLGDRLTLDTGLRFDQYSLATSAFHFSPRVNLAYRFPRQGTVLHASYNNFFVPPAVENVLFASSGLTRLVREIGRSLGPVRPVVGNQFELGVTQPLRSKMTLGLTGYYRVSRDPVHTNLLPDSRIYAYANFEREKAYGLEVRVDLPRIERLGLSGYLNYALGRVYFFNPVTGGFIVEAHHVSEPGRFLAPMDQTHTLTGGFTYQHHKSGVWAGLSLEYGSGTPTEADEHEGAAMGMPLPDRVADHFTANLSLGADLFRRGEGNRISLQFNVENLTDNVYKVAQESVFSASQFSIPRLFSGSARIHF